jgi:glycosyltransferase involved in cell wall biosynthesis
VTEDGRKSIWVLGTRGIPACHGGFETFAERLALFLAARDWQVSIFCQVARGTRIVEEAWCGVRLIKIPVHLDGPLGTLLFDLRSIFRVLRHPALVLNLGYNTACFGIALRLAHIFNVINMDGLEWQRAKWSAPVRAWLWLNERLGCHLGNHLIADHPEIARHIATRTRGRKISCIPYGSDKVDRADSPADRLPGGTASDGYTLVIARPEPENSILEIVDAFSRTPRPVSLIVVGDYNSSISYHRAVQEAAGPQVYFPGAIYDRTVVDTLRAHARLYVHGHRVGGTNPSLVEALGAGSPVLAHDNRFNRWVAGPEMVYFGDTDDCAAAFDRLLYDESGLARMRDAARRQHERMFVWDPVLEAYESLLTEALTTGQVSRTDFSWDLAPAVPDGPRISLQGRSKDQ